MPITPTISLVSWASRDPNFIFVKVPNEKGRYLRTDKSVLLVPCKFCGALKMEPCRRSKETPYSYVGTTHFSRRNLARLEVPSFNDVIYRTESEYLSSLVKNKPVIEKLLKKKSVLKSLREYANVANDDTASDLIAAILESLNEEIL